MRIFASAQITIYSSKAAGWKRKAGESCDGASTRLRQAQPDNPATKNKKSPCIAAKGSEYL
jgi:hypothetical protein